jgi:NAD(P) transhydrogenase subunit alpha
MSSVIRYRSGLAVLLFGMLTFAGCGGAKEVPPNTPGAKAVPVKSDETTAAETSATKAKAKEVRSPSEEIPPPSPAAATSPAVEPPHTTPPHAAPASDWTGMLFVFLLSALIGLGVITRVSRLLHTPLMSLTNAISAIAVVGAITVAGSEHHWFINFLGAVALFASTTNIVSGFLITDRMLKMFKRETRA